MKELIFIQENDELSQLINRQANLLYQKLSGFDASALETPDFFKDYFSKHHLNSRLFFSVQNSCTIIHESVMLSGKKIEEINFLDYGAGLGTLYMLASLIGFKNVYYNDYLEEWKNCAATICSALDLPINGYIVGDISNVVTYANEQNIKFNIIASRNVIEHIYSLEDFFSKISTHHPDCLVYNTTTANYHNPAMHLWHILIHRNAEKKWYIQQRSAWIQNKYPGISTTDLGKAVVLSRGYAFADFTNAVDLILQKKQLTPIPYLHTNTCDFNTGVWAEHLLPKKAYNNYMSTSGYTLLYKPGYWDTHYSNPIKNIFTGIANKLIMLLGDKGILFSPFVKIIAQKKH